MSRSERWDDPYPPYLDGAVTDEWYATPREWLQRAGDDDVVLRFYTGQNAHAYYLDRTDTTVTIYRNSREGTTRTYDLETDADYIVSLFEKYIPMIVDAEECEQQRSKVGSQ